ncbi:DUF4394 domain-containing protein [Methylibium petroleiphilum]|uniref:DUF4394 domain-containing protein n=1 Tax=Methylibium petroleiphilum TaxID=105560 RepID=UPI001AC31C48|nr:DUF4394 domain-containing protein [Methylibium petroleiphilum]MBN9204405.1 DUF4394 domain-containing protein [Methylibium petroleiphilum]
MTRIPLVAGLAALGLVGCALLPTPEAPGPLARETIVAVDTSQQLLRFNAGQPQKLLDRRALTGLQPGERVLGIDYRVARGQLFALGSSGRLYRIDTATAAATPVGAPLAVALRGSEFGVDFNPTVDRLRVASDAGQNLRLHPDTGAVVDADPKADGLQIDGPLAYDAADVNAGRSPAVVAAGYTYNKQDEKLTTNFAIDARQGVLVTQGSREGVQPVVSPNTGRLLTVGPLNAGAFERASFDISDVDNTAYAALTAHDARSSRWVRIDLATGAATPLGSITGGQPVVGIAIEP